jgi:small subunit ribosomal protein S1
VSEPDEDFASMFEASLQAKHVKKGQTVEGTIVAIGPEVAFVNIGGKGEALIEIAELKDDEGALEVAVGDRIQAVVVSTEGGLTLSRKLTRGAATQRQLEDAFHARLPVEGKVERAVKGGYEVRIARQRAFCPMSQIDILRSTNPNSMPRLHIPDPRVQDDGKEPRRLAARAARGGAASRCRRDPAIDRGRGLDRTRHVA